MHTWCCAAVRLASEELHRWPTRGLSRCLLLCVLRLSRDRRRRSESSLVGFLTKARNTALMSSRDADCDVPPSFFCPISMELMRDPVLTTDGLCYDRANIEQWFARGHRTSPLSGASLASTTLLSNNALRHAIEHREKKHSKVLQRATLTPVMSWTYVEEKTKEMKPWSEFVGLHSSTFHCRHLLPYFVGVHAICGATFFTRLFLLSSPSLLFTFLFTFTFHFLFLFLFSSNPYAVACDLSVEQLPSDADP